MIEFMGLCRGRGRGRQNKGKGKGKSKGKAKGKKGGGNKGKGKKGGRGKVTMPSVRIVLNLGKDCRHMVNQVKQEPVPPNSKFIIEPSCTQSLKQPVVRRIFSLVAVPQSPLGIFPSYRNKSFAIKAMFGRLWKKHRERAWYSRANTYHMPRGSK